MLDLKEGMLGVIVVALALAGALFVSFVAGVETTEEEYTAYEWLADVSGLFEYDESPTYIDFDPSTNYTGYYSTDTGEYWPAGLVDYEELKSNVNYYRVNLEPSTLAEDDIDIEDYLSGSSAPFSGSGRFWFATPDKVYYSYTTTTLTLASFVSALGLGSDVTDIELRSMDMYEDPEGASSYTAEWVNFSVKSWWEVIGNNAGITVATANWFEAMGGSSPYEWVTTDAGTLITYLPCLSVSVDLSRNIATLYYDNDCSEDQIWGTTSLDNIWMTCGGGSFSTTANMKLDGTLDITEYHTEKIYMDPNYGVDLTPTLMVYTYSDGNGVATGSGRYYVGDTVTISATPDLGYVFSSWDDGSTTATRTITVTSSNVGQAITYIAYFEAESS